MIRKTNFYLLILLFCITACSSSPKNTKINIGDNLPFGIGFGISTPNDVKKYVSVGVDAVIVGSANLKIIENTPPTKLQKKITEYTKRLKRSTRM